MRYRAQATPRGGLFFFLCTALSVMCLGLCALPAAAQEGPLAGTPAQGTNPDSPSSPPDLVTIAAEGYTVSEGASVTLEDTDGTQAQFVDGQLGIEIISTGGQISIVGPNDDYIGDHAVSSSDPVFDTAGDYAVVTTTGIGCQGASPPPTSLQQLQQTSTSPPSRKPRRSSSATRAILTTSTRMETRWPARPIPTTVAVVERVVAETWIVLTSPPTEQRSGNLRRTARTPTIWTPTMMG